MFHLPRPALMISAAALIAIGACNRAASAPPPPPAPTPTTAAPPTTAAAVTPTVPVMAPVAVEASGGPTPPAPVPGLPGATLDPSAVPLSADAMTCAAALRCCESTAHTVRAAARREGIDPRDPRYDPRRDPRYDDRYDPGYGDPRADPRVRRAVSRVVSGCRELRDPDEATASRCARQIESIRRAFREAGAAAPSSCRVPDLPAAPAPQ